MRRWTGVISSVLVGGCGEQGEVRPRTGGEAAFGTEFGVFALGGGLAVFIVAKGCSGVAPGRVTRVT